MKFNENLKYLRKEAKMTQENLAEELNVSRQAVTKWESGQSLPDIENLKQMADLFGVTMDSIVGDVQSKKESAINKKMKDIDLFLIVVMIILLSIFFSIYSFVEKITNNKDIIQVSTIVIGLVLYVVFVIMIKSYLKGKKKKIMNMKSTEDGKKERKIMIAKEGLKSLFSMITFSFISRLQSLPDGLEKYIIEVGKMIGASIILVLVIKIVKYIKLEKKVKELNQD